MHDPATLKAYREALARCKAYTAKNQCTAYVNARVHRHMTFDSPDIIGFSLTFHVDDWYTSDSTIARCDNGEVKSNL